MNLELRNDLQSRPSSGISVILSALTAAKLNRDQASSTASSLHLRRSAPPRILKSGHLSSNLQLLSVMPRPIPSSIAVVSSHRCSSSPSCSEPVMVSTVVTSCFVAEEARGSTIARSKIFSHMARLFSAFTK
ncbi:hypothetical protein DY000_02049906 [Brassica cretica]|uniref:Uncharacterized protein n=1 Tax=Brassica cretica TaxID=69181 RepID=A0ABQ7EPF9_BRACR|nr:hypothetical protein DY000_02049906 [Brassica cretica]